MFSKKNKNKNKNIKNKNRKNKIKNKTIKNKTIYSEFLCIGAGFSNAYACYLLKQKNIHRGKIIVLEKSDRYGGRIESVYTNTITNNKQKVVYDELGAARFFKSKPTEKIFDLLKLFGLQTVKVSLEDSKDIFYYQGKKYFNKEALLSNGMKIFHLEEYILNNIKKEYPGIDFNDIYDYEEFRYMTIPQLFIKYGNLTEEDVDMFIAYNGYNYHLDNTQATPWLNEKVYYSTEDKENQYYLKDGMISFPRKLFENSNAEIIYNTMATSIEKDTSGYNIVTTIETTRNGNIYKKYKCKYLFIGLTATQLKNLNMYKPIPISPLRLTALYDVVAYPLLKIFLKWDRENVWWGKDKYKTGKSTTDLPIRIVYYYNDEDIMICNSGKYATDLYYKILEDPEKTFWEVYKQVEIMHEMSVPPPNFSQTKFKYHPERTSQWLIGADVKRNIEIVPNGFVDKSNIYIIGDCYTKYQGYIIGAMNSVETALKPFMR